MKKLIALLLTLALALGCAAAFGEAAVSTVTSVDGSFSISFQLPEGTELLSGAWDEAGDLYQANLKGQNGLFYYLAVAAPVAAEGEEGETTPVTFNEDNSISIALHIVVDYGVNIITLCQSIMSEVSYKVFSATGVTIRSVDVFVDAIQMN